MNSRAVLARGVLLLLSTVGGFGNLCGQTEQKADRVYSGPQPGEAIPELDTLPLFDDTDSPWDPANAPAIRLFVFVHERTRPAFGVLRGIASYANQLGNQIDGVTVFLTDDLVETKRWAGVARRSIPAGLNMRVSNDGIEGPGAWGLNRNASLTVVLGKDGKVVSNFALVQPSAAVDLPLILNAIAKALGVEPPNSEQIAAWTGRPAMEEQASSDVNIRPLLAPVIRRNATAEEVHAAAAKVAERADQEPTFAQAVGDACRRIVAAGKLENYGNATAQHYLSTWAKSLGKPPDDSPEKTPDR